MPQLAFETYSPQLAWLAITFILLLLVMWRVALPRIGEVLEERQNRIQHDLDEAERLKTEAEQALAGYDAALAGARAAASAQLGQARARLMEELDGRRGEVEAVIAAETAKAEDEIAAARARAMAGIRDAAADATRAVVERLTGVTAGEPAVAAAVDAALGQGD